LEWAGKARPLRLAACILPVEAPRCGMAAGPLDMRAVAAALEVRDTWPAAGEVHVLAMGPPAAETGVRECLALGADAGRLLTDPAFAGADTLATARVLARALHHLGPFDLVFCGARSAGGGTGQVGPQVAELLGCPLVPAVVDLRLTGGPGGSAPGCSGPGSGPDFGLRLEAVSGLEGLRAHWRLEAPAVLVVAPELCRPRPLGLAGIVAARGRPVDSLDHESLGLNPDEVGERGSPTRVDGLRPAPGGRAGERLAGLPSEVAAEVGRRLRQRLGAARHGDEAKPGDFSLDVDLPVAADDQGVADRVTGGAVGSVAGGTPPMVRPAAADADPPRGAVWVYAGPDPAPGSKPDWQPPPAVADLLAVAAVVARDLEAPLGMVLCPPPREPEAESALGSTVEVELLSALPSCGADHALLLEGVGGAGSGSSGASAAAEPRVAALAAAVAQWEPRAVFFPDTWLDSLVAAGLAARLETGLVAHCTGVEVDDSGRLLHLVPAPGGREFAVITCPERRPSLLTARAGVLAPPGGAQSYHPAAVDAATSVCRAFRRPAAAPDRPVLVPTLEPVAVEASGAVSLSQARVVIGGGAGVPGDTGWQQVHRLAGLLRAAVGGTRPPLDSGRIPPGKMIGQSGVAVAPDIYLALGISGEMQHMVGLRRAGLIIAVNSDPNAPIFDQADIGVVADLAEFLPSLLTWLDGCGVPGE